VNKSGPIAPTSIFARGQRRPPAGPEGAAASGKALGEVALLSPDEALRRLSSTADGLTPDQVEQQLRLVGRNEVAHQARHTILGELVRRSINPLNLLLLSLATASYFLGDQRAAIVIAVMVGLSIALGFIQEHRLNKAAEALQRMVRITAAVRRKMPGAAQDHVEVPIEQLVPGDIVLLSAGDMIPADMRLISANDLFINQSALTGEAMPLEKVAAAHVGTAETPFDLPNICFMGSAVVSGVGCGVVVLTGARTAFGQVAGTIAEQRVLTSFDKGITRFTWLMLGFILVMAPLVFVINGVTKGNWLEALLFAVAVAVGLTPEMLPMIVTVNLAKGAMAMSRKKVIVKRLNAIQNFGAMDVLCTDKTGTLTENRMRVDLIAVKGRPPLPLSEHVTDVEHRVRRVLALANDATLDPPTGDPMEVALAEAVGADLVHELRSLQPRLASIPFDADRRLMSSSHQTDGQVVLLVKGAPEAVLTRCVRILTSDGTVTALDDTDRAEVLRVAAELAGRGARVLGLADRSANSAGYPDIPESELTFLGLISLRDPVRAEAADAVRMARSAGVRVVMVTGDHPGTAMAIAVEAGIAEPGSRAAIGTELSDRGAPDIGDVSVYARGAPPISFSSPYLCSSPPVSVRSIVSAA